MQAAFFFFFSPNSYKLVHKVFFFIFSLLVENLPGYLVGFVCLDLGLLFVFGGGLFLLIPIIDTLSYSRIFLVFINFK